MLFWILAGLVVFLAGAYLPSVFLAASVGVGPNGYFGARDNEPQPGVMHGRAARAHRNHLENIPVFLALGILALVVEGADISLAVLGAQLYVFGRLAFLLAYLSGIPFLRSTVFAVAWIGLVLMAIALI